MGLCGGFRCGCGVTSTPAVEGAINGELPSILVSGSGEPGDPFDLQLNDAWAAEVAATSAWVADDAPRGVMGYAEITANSVTFTVLTIIAGLSVTFDAVAGRRYRWTFRCETVKSVGSDVFTLAMENTSVQLSRVYCPAGPTADWEQRVGVYVNDASISGSTTWRINGQRIVGSGNMYVAAATDRPAFVLVEDIGPL